MHKTYVVMQNKYMRMLNFLIFCCTCLMQNMM